MVDVCVADNGGETAVGFAPAPDDEANEASRATGASGSRQPRWPRLGIVLGSGLFRYKMQKMQKNWMHAVLPVARGKIKLD
jgi:hypothetical protein